MVQERAYPYSDLDWPHSFSVDYARLYPAFFDRIPNLEDALRDETGDLLFTRFMMAPFALLESPFLYEIWDRTHGVGQFMSIKHPPELSADGNIKAVALAKDAIAKRLGIDTRVGVLKTVTIAFPLQYEEDPEDERHLIVLYGGIGDFRVTKQTKRDIATALGLDNYSAKNAIINPEKEVFDPKTEIGIIPGQIKPIISRGRVQYVHAICYAHQDAETAMSHVAITDSPFDSFIVPVSVFEDVFQWYADRYYLPLATQIALPGVDMYRTNAPLR